MGQSTEALPSSWVGLHYINPGIIVMAPCCHLFTHIIQHVGSQEPCRTLGTEGYPSSLAS